jgi:creatinine amidohydrolase/Fe(II)-dependent formamide hydrolase-like protein
VPNGWPSERKFLSINAQGQARLADAGLQPAGACGDATLATAEKGEAVLDARGPQFIELLQRPRQHQPRLAVQQPTLALKRQ